MKRIWVKWITLVCVGILGLVIFVACGGSDGDDDSSVINVSGTWLGVIDDDDGGQFSLTLQQNGTTVSGTYKDDVFEAPLQEGKINDDILTAILVDPTDNETFDIEIDVVGDEMYGTTTSRTTGEIIFFTAVRN